MKRLGMIGLLVGSLGLATQAETIQIGTGLDASGNLLSAGSLEQNYGVGGNASDAVVYYLGSPWVANVANGQWISPSDALGNLTDPQYSTTTYTRTIDGTGTLSGEFASDNPGELLVNGVEVASTPGWPTTDDSDYSYWTGFSDISLDQAVNTIEFDVYNSYGPAGLIVAGTATVNTASVPDGGLTAMLLGMGLAGMGVIRRKLS
jgi:hypothetical protein